MINAVSQVFNPSPLPLFHALVYCEAKLDLQVRALEQQLEEERANHGHASEEVMHEAKQWLAGLQHSVGFCVVVSNEVRADDESCGKVGRPGVVHRTSRRNYEASRITRGR